MRGKSSCVFVAMFLVLLLGSNLHFISLSPAALYAAVNARQPFSFGLGWTTDCFWRSRPHQVRALVRNSVFFVKFHQERAPTPVFGIPIGTRGFSCFSSGVDLKGDSCYSTVNILREFVQFSGAVTFALATARASPL